MNVRTTDTDRLEYLRLFLGSLEAHLAQGDDLEDMIKKLRKVVAKKEKEMAQ
jgi:hypothetical protein